MTASIDSRLFDLINGLAGNSAAFDRAVALFARFSPYVIAALLVLLWFSGQDAKRLRDREAVIHAGAAVLLGLVVTQLITMAWHRPRPFLVHHATVLVPRVYDSSFPSNHAMAAFAIATAVILYDRTIGIALMALAALVALSRVYVGLHYPGDIAAGALIGAVVAVGLLAARPLLDRAAHLVDVLWRRVGLP